METEKTVNKGKALAEYISSFDYGTVIHYQDIEMITKEKRGASRYYNSIYKAKSILESNGKAIKSIGGGDYQIIYPGDYSGAYVRQVRLAKTRIKRGGKIIRNAPVNDMSDEERQTFNHVSDFHAQLNAKLIGSYVEVKRLASKKDHPFAVQKS